MLDTANFKELVLYATIDRGFRAVNNVNEQITLYPDDRYIFERMTPYNTFIVNMAESPPKVMTFHHWHRYTAPDLGVCVSERTILTRIESGWTLQKALACGPHEGRINNKVREKAKYVIGDQCKTAEEWCKEYSISATTVFKRMRFENMTFEEALTRPLEKTGPKARHYTYNGETHTLDEWARITGIKPMTIRTRLYQGWELGEALGTPVERRRQRL